MGEYNPFLKCESWVAVGTMAYDLFKAKWPDMPDNLQSDLSPDPYAGRIAWVQANKTPSDCIVAKQIARQAWGKLIELDKAEKEREKAHQRNLEIVKTAASIIETAKISPPPQQPPMAPCSENLFRCHGDFWEIRFEGRKLPPVRRLAGMIYIHELLSRPGRSITALELHQKAFPPPPNEMEKLSEEEAAQYGQGGSVDRPIDEKMAKELEARKREIEEKLEEPGLNKREAEQLEEDLGKIELCLASARVAPTHGGAIIEKKKDKQPRQNVAKAIEKAVASIADTEGGGNLAKHLSAIITGRDVQYVGGLTWET